MADIKRSKNDEKLLDSRPYTGIDFGFIPLNGNQHKIHNHLHESTLDSRAYTWINFGFLSLHENWHQIPGPWWESLNPNSHHIKESWLGITSIMEIKYGCQSTMRMNFNGWTWAWWTWWKRDTYIRAAPLLEQDLFRCSYRSFSLPNSVPHLQQLTGVNFRFLKKNS